MKKGKCPSQFDRAQGLQIASFFQLSEHLSEHEGKEEIVVNKKLNDSLNHFLK